MTDLAGNKLDFAKARVFKTATVPLTIVSMTPEDNSVDVEVDQEIVITFSEPIDESTVTLYWTGGGPSFNTSVNGEVLTVAPSTSWTEFESDYQLNISANIKDVNGNALASTAELSFTTIFVSERYYYFIRNYEGGEYLAFQDASPQVTYVSEAEVSSNFRLWRFVKSGDQFAIRNYHLRQTITAYRSCSVSH